MNKQTSMIKSTELNKVKAPKALMDIGYLHFTYNAETFRADVTRYDGRVDEFPLMAVLQWIVFDTEKEAFESRLKSVEHVHYTDK
jgi:hypothetical protein